MGRAPASPIRNARLVRGPPSNTLTTSVVSASASCGTGGRDPAGGGSPGPPPARRPAVRSRTGSASSRPGCPCGGGRSASCSRYRGSRGHGSRSACRRGCRPRGCRAGIRAAPPRTGDRGQHMMMVPVRQVMVLGGVGVAGEAQHLATGEQIEERGAVGGRVAGIVRRGVGVQRDMHREHDQVVPGISARRFFRKARLRSPTRAPIGVGADRHRRPKPLDVVEHHEPRPPMPERVGRRTENPLPGLAAVTGVRGLHVEVVIARQAVPGQADPADDPVGAAVERQIVEQHVASGQPERRRDRHGPGDRRIPTWSSSSRLSGWGSVNSRTSKSAGSSTRVRVKSIEAGSGPVGATPDSADQFRGRAARLVDVGMARHVVGVARQGVARRLDHEDHPVARHRQAVAAPIVRAHDLAAVGDQHARQRRPVRAGRIDRRRRSRGLRGLLRRGARPATSAERGGARHGLPAGEALRTGNRATWAAPARLDTIAAAAWRPGRCAAAKQTDLTAG